MDALLELRHISKSYTNADGTPVPVLREVSLSITAGQRLAIVGPSGCGKSTLLNLMGGLDRPTGGVVMMDNHELELMNDTELARQRAMTVGFIFQQHHLLPQCSVLENVLIPTLVSGVNASDRARQLLDRVGLGAHLNQRPAQLSGGERQRVAVVRALINQPRLLLADEPTGALDEASAASLMDLLLELNRSEGVALVVVTHASALAARLDQILTLRQGRLSAA
jgi:lipoprotein-releasing system ATP-binding protein